MPGFGLRRQMRSSMKNVVLVLTLVGTSVAFVAQLAGQEPPAAAPGRGGRGGPKGPPPPPAGPMPRLPDGHPNMQGFWTPPAITDIEPPPPRAGRGPAPAAAPAAPANPGLAATGFGGGGGIRIVDPPDGKIPYKPEARAKQQDILQNHMADEPELHCYQSGVPHS